MNLPENYNIKYFNISNNDEAWGIIVTTVGSQLISPQSLYPRSQHPKSHVFNPKKGRVLKEYQLIYIPQGCGYFESESIKKQRVEAGSIILLFPNEWHTYEPEKETGWYEYWVGFKGKHIDNMVKSGFFTPQSPIFHIGFSFSIICLFQEIAHHTQKERTGYQQVVSSIVLYMLSLVSFKNKNMQFTDFFAINKIDEARATMKQKIESDISPEKIAKELGVSYSWFRKMFKQYVGVSPVRYLLNLKFIRSKELLDMTDLTINEIAHKLNFETSNQFSTFFRKKEGIPPLQYRKEVRSIKR